MNERVERREQGHRIRIGGHRSCASCGAHRRLKGEALTARNAPRPWQPVDLNVQQRPSLCKSTHQLLALQRPVGLHPDAVRRGESKVAVSRQEGVFDLLLFGDAALQHVARDQPLGKVKPAARAVTTGQVQQARKLQHLEGGAIGGGLPP